MAVRIRPSFLIPFHSKHTRREPHADATVLRTRLKSFLGQFAVTASRTKQRLLLIRAQALLETLCGLAARTQTGKAARQTNEQEQALKRQLAEIAACRSKGDLGKAAAKQWEMFWRLAEAARDV